MSDCQAVYKRCAAQMPPGGSRITQERQGGRFAMWALNRNSSAKHLFLGLLTMGIGLGGSSDLLAEDYATLVAAFSGTTAILCGEDSLMNYLRRVKKGDGAAIFTDEWDGKEGICKFSIEKGKIVSSKMIRKEKEAENYEVEFYWKDGLPALLAYNGKVYLNLPRLEILELNEESILLKQLSDEMWRAMLKLRIEMPTAKVRCRCDRGHVVVGDFHLNEKVTQRMVEEAVARRKEKDLYKEWKRQHEIERQRLPRRPPVVYGDVDHIIRKWDDTFVIPRSYCSAGTRTTTTRSTVWAHGSGSFGGARFNVSMPIGTQVSTRTKTLTQMYDYNELEWRLKDYERRLARWKNARPPQVDVEAIREELLSYTYGYRLELSILRKKK